MARRGAWSGASVRMNLQGGEGAGDAGRSDASPSPDRVWVNDLVSPTRVSPSPGVLGNRGSLSEFVLKTRGSTPCESDLLAAKRSGVRLPLGPRIEWPGQQAAPEWCELDIGALDDSLDTVRTHGVS